MMRKIRRYRSILHFCLLAVVLLGMSTYLILIQLERTTIDANRRAEAVIRLKVYIGYLTAAETGQRGYLLTGDPNYLDRYRSALSRLPDHRRAMFADPFLRGSELDQLITLGDAKTAELEHSLKLYGRGNSAAAMQLVRSGQGRSLMNQARDRAIRLGTRLWNDSQRKEEYNSRLNRWCRLAIIAIGASAITLVLLATTTMMRHWKHKLEAESREKEARLQLSHTRSDLQKQSSFLNSISHDMRTPLNALGLMSEVAEMYAEPQQVELKEALGEIRRSAGGLTNLLESIMEVGRAETVPLRTVDVDASDLIGDIISQFRALAEQKGLHFIASAQPLRFRSDRLMIQRILMNLVSNAIKFTERGDVLVDLWQDGKLVMIKVSDTGIGIQQDQLSQLFADFYQVGNAHRAAGGGFGLGLSICWRLVQRLGGDITADSTPGVGSSFTVQLPEIVE